MPKKKLDPKTPKLELKVRKMWWDWWKLQGYTSLKKFIKNNWTLYFVIKGVKG
jgi:hypothetical protein